jgi:preprotein translocase subunit SecA
MRQIERSLMLQFLDHHGASTRVARSPAQGIHLRGYAQKNPKQEYKREAFELFSEMLDRIKQDVVKLVLTVQLRSERTCRRWKSRRACRTSSTSTRDTTKRWRRPPRRRRRGGDRSAVHARGEKGGSQRSMPVRVGQEIQALPRKILGVCKRRRAVGGWRDGGDAPLASV